MLVDLEELLKVLPPNNTEATSRTSASAASAATAAAIRQAAPSSPKTLDSLRASLWETWPEAVLLLLAVLCYFCLDAALATLKRRRRKHCAGLSKPAVKPSNRAVSVVKLESWAEDPEIRRFVANIGRKGGRCGAEALQQYDILARGGRRSDLQRCLKDEVIARPFYQALLAACTRSASAPAAATPSTSVARLWASKLLADMRAWEIPRSAELYASALRLFSGRGLVEETLWLYDLMAAESLSPDREALVCLLHAAISLGLEGRALFFFREAARQGKPSMRTCMAVLRLFAQKQDWQGAVNFLGDIQAAGARPDALVLNTVLGQCIAAAHLEEAAEVLRQWEESADTISCNILLKGHAQQADLARAEALLENMLARGPAPNIITFNTVLDCIVRKMQATAGSVSRKGPAPVGTGEVTALAKRPWAVLEQLLSLGMRPDRYTCSTLVKGMHLVGCSGGQLDLAVQLLREIGPEGLQTPSAGAGKTATSATVGGNGAPGGGGEVCNTKLVEVIFNTLLDACASLQDLDRMAQIFKMMEEFGVAISAVTFGTLIKAFGQAKHLEHCREVWQRMRLAGVAPTVVTFGCYIDACLRAGDLSGAEGAFKAMREADVHPNAVVYTSLIRGYAQARQPQRALELYNAMREEGIEATAMTFNTVLNVLAVQLPDRKTLLDVVNEMHRMHIPPDVVTYSILIKASCSAGHLDSALGLLRELRDHGLATDGVAFNTLLLACSRAERIAAAEEVYEEMRSSGVEPTHVTASILVKMYGRAKMLDKAEEVSRQIQHIHGRTPNLHVYTCLIQACVQNKQVRRSWELFNEMLGAGIQPDAITYGTMIHGCIYHNKFEVAMELVRHAQQLPSKATARGEQPVLALSSLRLDRPVPLQAEVLKSLHAALQRKAHASLIAELEEANLVLP